MLETVRSRQLYGFLILTVLPASFAIGYFLKDRKDAQTIESTLPIPGVIKPQVATEERIKMLRRREMELDRERKDVLEKIKRVKGREASV